MEIKENSELSNQLTVLEKGIKALLSGHDRYRISKRFLEEYRKTKVMVDKTISLNFFRAVQEFFLETMRDVLRASDFCAEGYTAIYRAESNTLLAEFSVKMQISNNSAQLEVTFLPSRDSLHAEIGTFPINDDGFGTKLISFIFSKTLQCLYLNDEKGREVHDSKREQIYLCGRKIEEQFKGLL